MIKMGAKRGRTFKQLSPVSCDLDLKSSPIIASAVKVASNEDLLIEILLHVPIKTLLGFKSVSKQWLSLINDPRFVRLHYSLPSASALFFVSSSCRSNPDYQFIPLDVSDYCPIPFKTLNFVHDPLGSGISVLQSCNGLLLCASYRAREFNHRYYVYNPTTKQFVTLPQIKREYSKNVCGMSLAFNPAESPYYKVICVRRSKTSSKLYQIEIYSSETRLWRVSGQPFIAPKYTEFQTYIYWSGSVHWWNGFVHSSLWSDEPYTLYFKVEEERVEQLSMAIKHIGTVELHEQEMVESCSAELHEQVATYLGESEGHWHLVDVYSDSTCLFNVYEMASDYSGWFVKYQVDLSVVSNVFPEIIKNDRRYGYEFNILSIVRRGKEEEDGSFLVLEIPGGKLVRYNFSDKSVEKLWEFDPVVYKFYYDNGLKYVYALPYMESIACV